MPATKFDNVQGAVKFLTEHPNRIGVMFCDVLEVPTQELAKEVGVDLPGYYIVRTDMYRFLSAKYSIVRDMEGLYCHEPRKQEERQPKGCMAP